MNKFIANAIPDDVAHISYTAPNMGGYYRMMRDLIQLRQAFVTRPLEMRVIILDVRY